jgi:hypothetical protein
MKSTDIYIEIKMVVTCPHCKKYWNFLEGESSEKISLIFSGIISNCIWPEVECLACGEKFTIDDHAICYKED